MIHILDSVSKKCQMKMAEPKRQNPITSKRKELTTLRYPVLEALELDRLWLKPWVPLKCRLISAEECLEQNIHIL